jgi:hypothetical protein
MRPTSLGEQVLAAIQRIQPSSRKGLA